MNRAERIKWVKLAVSTDPNRKTLKTPFISDSWELATDGDRIHIGKLDEFPSPKDTDGIDFKRLTQKPTEPPLGIRFTINPQFLIEALQGMESNQVTIELLENGTMVHVSNPYEAWDNNEAYIMCMQGETDPMD